MKRIRETEIFTSKADIEPRLVSQFAKPREEFIFTDTTSCSPVKADISMEHIVSFFRIKE
jgi:hypothetical protein